MNNLINRIMSQYCVAGNGNGLEDALKESLCQHFDSCETDALGSITFTKKLSEGKRLMLVCGMDTSGLVATFAEGSKINVSSVGSFHVANMAFSKVSFGEVKGTLIPLGGYDFSTPITDYAVETYDIDASEKITLGDTAYFDEPSLYDEKSGMAVGFGSATKMCVYLLTEMAIKLISGDNSFLRDNGIGELCVCFANQESLGSRGASALSCAVNPDEIISICPMDMTEKNVGSFSFSDGVAVKMLDKGFVATEETSVLAENLLDSLSIRHKRRVSNNSRSALSRLGLCGKGAGLAEIGIAHKFAGTRGETVKNPFKA